MMLALSVMAFLSSRQSAVSSEVSVTDDLEESITTFSSAISNIIFQNIFSLFSGFYFLINSIDKSLSLQGALGQVTAPNLLTLQTNLSISDLGSIALPSDNEYGFFVSTRYQLYFITIDDPQNPAQLSRLASFTDYDYVGALVLSTDNQKIVIVKPMYSNTRLLDVSDPANVKSIFSIVRSETSVALFYPNNRYFLIASQKTILVSNASLLTASIITEFTGRYAVISMLFKKNGQTLFAGHAAGISIINTQNVSAFELINTIPFNGAQSMALSSNEQLLYAAYNNGAVAGALSILNVTNTSDVKLLGRVNLACNVKKIQVTSDNHYAYLACSSGVICVDISNASAPKLIFMPSMVNNTLDLALRERNGFIYAITDTGISVFRVNYAALPTLAPTFAPLTLIPPTPIPLTDAPLTIMPPPPPSLVPAVLTLLPPTPSPTTAVPAPVVTLPAKPSVQPVPSGQTALPNIALHFNTTFNHKIEIVGAIVNRSITLFLQVASNIAVYMQGTAGLGSEYDPVSGALKMITRDESDANTRLATVRFSPRVNNTAAYNRTVVDMVASQGSDHQAWGSAILSNFGSNRAPEIISNATLFFQAVNRAVELDSDFSVDFNQIVSDLDLDPLIITITSLSDDSLPFGMRLRNNILSCTCSWDGLKLFLALISDLYLSTQFTISIRCDDFPPTVINAIENIVARPGVNSVREITWGNIFKGAVREINAVLENGYPLPFGITLLNVAPGFSRLSVSMAGDGLFNVTVIATARFGKKANTTLLVSVYDYPPQITENITNFYIANALMQTDINLAGVITDFDDAASTSTGELRLLPNNSLIPSIWGQLDTLSEIFSFTPPITMVNQTKGFSYKKGDPSGKYALFNFSVLVPIPDAPIINARIQNITGAPGTVTFELPSNAFNSSYLSQLKLTAELLTSDGAIALPDGYQWRNQNGITNGNALTMPLAEGLTRVRFNVTDPFNNIASQIAQANLATSLADNLLNIIIALGAATGITAVAQYFQLFVGIINAIRLTWYSRPCIEIPFSNRDDTYAIRGLEGQNLKVFYYQKSKIIDLNIIKILFVPILVAVSTPFLFTILKHAIEQLLSLSEIERPNWLTFNVKKNIFSIAREQTVDDERVIIVRVYGPNDMLVGAFEVNPIDFTQLFEFENPVDVYNVTEDNSKLDRQLLSYEQQYEFTPGMPSLGKNKNAFMARSEGSNRSSICNGEAPTPSNASSDDDEHWSSHNDL